MRYSDIVIVCFLLLCNFALWFWWSVGAGDLLVREHGLLEMAQMVCIALSMLVFIYVAVSSRGAVKSASISLAGLSFAMLFREMDWRGLNISTWFDWISRGGPRDVTLSMILLVLLAYMLVNRKDFSGWMRMAFSVRAWPLHLSAIMILVGGVLFDIVPKDAPQLRFWEELVEFNGYAFLLIAALRHATLANDEEAA